MQNSCFINGFKKKCPSKVNCSLFKALFILLCFLSFYQPITYAESLGNISGKIRDSRKNVLSLAVIKLEPGNYTTFSDVSGNFSMSGIPLGSYSLTVSHLGFKSMVKEIEITAKNLIVEIKMEGDQINLSEIEVLGFKDSHLSITHLKDVSGTEIMAGKKNEVILLDKINSNLAVNNARETFAKVSGLNIWENDGSGIQMNVSVRGLSPNRSWDLNNRQNGYNIQADVIGYPDTYYSPPLEAVESIELVRGSSSLNYGTQIGGMINYRIKQSSGKKPFEIETIQTRGSYNLFNSFNSVGGTYKKLSYYGYYHHRSAQGWRKNSDYRWNTAYASMKFKANDHFSISGEITYMKYLLHLSGGLTDSLFKVDARQSVRDRNWFEVEWLIPAVVLDYEISPKLKLNMRNYVLTAKRNSVEHTVPVNIPDDQRNRDLRKDTYLNFSSETRLLYSYNLAFLEENILGLGLRYYNGVTTRGQGWGTNGADADFSFVNPDLLEYHDYSFHTNNLAFYIENIFKVTKRFSIIPGFRYEWIDLNGEGYYNASGVKKEEKNLESVRRIPLFGLGFQYHINKKIDLYSNYTQGYRAINFNDIRVTNPNIIIDKDLKDSDGYNLDLGVRGKIRDFLVFDVSLFYLQFNDRIGVETRKDDNGKDYQFSTNISNSRNVGLESMIDFDIVRYLNPNSRNGLSFYTTYSFIDAKYLNANNSDLNNKKVETVPANILRTGFTFRVRDFSTTLNFSYVDEQFSDANNTKETITGNNGIIPAYEVFDLSSSYKFKNIKLGLSLNNLLNKKYATRRATGYPGPGLIPGEPRLVNVSLGIKI